MHSALAFASLALAAVEGKGLHNVLHNERNVGQHTFRRRSSY